MGRPVRVPRLFDPQPVEVAPGAVHVPGWLSIGEQRGLVAACWDWIRAAGGANRPVLPNGGVMSVAIACLGWHWAPYQYRRSRGPGPGMSAGPVAAFPRELGTLARSAVSDTFPEELETFAPDVALVNVYGADARMGMHADREERSEAPVVSVSLGDSAVFRFGNPRTRSRPWTDVVLESGDLFVFGGVSRRAFHGVPKLYPGSGTVHLGGGACRFNVTVRQTGLER